MTTLLTMCSAGVLAATAMLSPQEGGSNPQRQQPDTRATPWFLTGEKLLDATVSAPGDRENTADVDAAVVDRRTGRILYAILDTNGILGTENRQVAVPYGALEWLPGSEPRFALHATAGQMMSLPAVEPEKFAQDADPALTSVMRGIFGDQPELKWSEPTPEAGDQKHGTRWMLLGNLDGKELRAGDEEVGEISGCVAEVRGGSVAFVLVSMGGVLGIGDTVYPVPFKALAHTGGDDGCKVDLAADRFKVAPKLSPEGIADLRDPSFVRRVHDYYGLRAPDFEIDRNQRWRRTAERDNSAPDPDAPRKPVDPGAPRR